MIAKPASSMTVATVRTAVQTTILAAVVTGIFKITGWQVAVEDLLPFVPVLLPVAAVFYRLSRAVGDRWPVVGYILFGIPRPPIYAPEPLPPPVAPLFDE